MFDSTWNSQISDAENKYRAQLVSYNNILNTHSTLKTIADKIVTSAANASLNAAYGGSHGDSGAAESIKQFATFLDGFRYAEGGTAGCYQSVIDQLEKEKDSEYQKYLELKDKFESK